MTDVSQAIAERRDRAFLGHPVGLGWLGGTEFWERFSYYGMQALLVLYMVHQLFTPQHIGHVLGFDPFQRFVAMIYGPATGQALASHIFGLYTSLVYLTPIGGGLIADRWLGRTASITMGAILMALGHFLMAFDASFLFALLCLLLGVGMFKGNIAGQVGELYKLDDPRRATAYQMFLLTVQVAVVASPLVCGTLGEVYGWHYGFGAAGIGMLIGLVTYLIGRYALPKDTVKSDVGQAVEAGPKLQQADWIKIAVLVFLLPVMAISLVGNQEIFNAYLIWSEANYQLVFFGKTMPITWLLSFDALFSALTMIASMAFWKWWSTRRAEPDEITKMTIGITIAALAPLMLALASIVVAQTHQKVGLWYAVGFHVINDLGFANVLPIGIALYSRAAPKGMSGVMIGIYYLHLFMSNLFTGWLGGLYSSMSAPSFWFLHVALMVGAAAVMLIVKFGAGHIIAPAYQKDVMEEEAAAVA
ncbi:MAG: peptide MFS transporter [Alphaproteobacteria bacterium]|nr:peptide MFS transporter [Alphaproteobacteria bacterium]MBL7096535.1 peptide MFS transporter [Alphaproteobacteria bacterium]